MKLYRFTLVAFLIWAVNSLYAIKLGNAKPYVIAIVLGLVLFLYESF